MTETTGADAPASVENSIAAEIDAAKAPITPVEADPTPAADAVPGEPAKRNREQERYDELTREKYDARRERDQERFRREAAEAELESLKKAPTQPVAPADYPTLASVDFDEARHAVAVAAYFQKTVAKTYAELREEERAQEKQQEIRKTWDQRTAEFAKSKPDYYEKVGRETRDGGPWITNEMAQVIQRSELGTQVAYYLSENVPESYRIAAMSQVDQAREIGRIEARLEAQKAPPPAVVSKAPPPPPKIETADPKVVKNPNEMSDKEFAAWRHRQMAR